mmetsp:Transcript_30427/g.76190  ORF Transcript_30427/g.76190 Transcript_30427/m.76190 type:complete len:277 (+) Transcript_30427:4661-5491(+)
MRHHHMLCHRFAEGVRHVKIFEKYLGDRPQRVLGPGGEPVDDSVVDHARKVATAGAQGVTHRGHGQHHVQVGAAPIDVIAPARLLGFSQTLLGYFVADAVDDAVLLLVGIQRGHHPASEHVVDELQEPLVGNVRVGKEKHHLFVLHANHGVQLLQVLAEHVLVVPPRQGDLEHSAAGGVRGKLGQALFARAPHTHEQRVALIEADDAMNASEVLERIFEKHQVHGFVFFVVTGEDLVEQGLDVGVGAHVLVQAQNTLLALHLLGRVQVVAVQDGIR